MYVSDLHLQSKQYYGITLFSYPYKKNLFFFIWYGPVGKQNITTSDPIMFILLVKNNVYL